LWWWGGADDGSAARWFGGAAAAQVVDNGGLHGDVERCGRMTLAAGQHRAQVDFMWNIIT
jgi:hypothetical protein